MVVVGVREHDTREQDAVACERFENRLELAGRVDHECAALLPVHGQVNKVPVRAAFKLGHGLARVGALGLELGKVSGECGNRHDLAINTGAIAWDKGNLTRCDYW